jgi:two-component system chemotaxis response regulator CheY
MKTLIVEDDYITARVLSEIMKDFGDTQMAETGKEATGYFENALGSGNKFELVLLDIMLPEMDGQEVLENIRTAETNIGIEGLDRVKVVMITALGDYHNIGKAFKNQCEGYIVKPIEKDKLIEVLKDLELI